MVQDDPNSALQCLAIRYVSVACNGGQLFFVQVVVAPVHVLLS